MSLIDTLLPETANNEYRGGKIPFVVFCLMVAVTTFRSLVHFVKDDSGVNSIASIHVFPGDPDPNQVIYMFSSLWGSQQMIMVIVYLLVLYRYRNLIPLMFALFAVEVVFRLSVGAFIHPLTEEFYVRTPPGKVGNLPFLVVSLAMVYVSHRSTSGAKEAKLEAATT